eukprot:3150079-Amphidinium_carterae.2
MKQKCVAVSGMDSSLALLHPAGMADGEMQSEELRLSQATSSHPLVEVATPERDRKRSISRFKMTDRAPIKCQSASMYEGIAEPHDVHSAAGTEKVSMAQLSAYQCSVLERGSAADMRWHLWRRHC